MPRVNPLQQRFSARFTLVREGYSGSDPWADLKERRLLDHLLRNRAANFNPIIQRLRYPALMATPDHVTLREFRTPLQQNFAGKLSQLFPFLQSILSRLFPPPPQPRPYFIQFDTDPLKTAYPGQETDIRVFEKTLKDSIMADLRTQLAVEASVHLEVEDNPGTPVAPQGAVPVGPPQTTREFFKSRFDLDIE